jgi:tetratricopeptide (TPR) repeat protein
MNIIKKLFAKKENASQEQNKKLLPVEYQLKMELGEFSKGQLIEIQKDYILQAEHFNSIGTAFRRLEEYDLAEENYLHAIELSPEYEDPYANLLSLYILLEKYDQYEMIYHKGMANSSGSKSSIVYQDGRLHFIKGNYHKALMAARSCLTVEQFQDELSFVLAIKSLLALVKQGEEVEENNKEAKSLFEFGMKIFPDSALLKELSNRFTWTNK